MAEPSSCGRSHGPKSLIFTIWSCWSRARYSMSESSCLCNSLFPVPHSGDFKTWGEKCFLRVTVETSPVIFSNERPLVGTNSTIVLPFRLDFFRQKSLTCVPGSPLILSLPPPPLFLIRSYCSFPQSLMTVAVKVTNRAEKGLCRPYRLSHRELPRVVGAAQYIAWLRDDQTGIQDQRARSDHLRHNHFREAASWAGEILRCPHQSICPVCKWWVQRKSPQLKIPSLFQGRASYAPQPLLPPLVFIKGF